MRPVRSRPSSRYAIIILAALVLIISGCAGGEKPPTTAGEPPATTGAPASPDSTIIFERSGGIAGLHDKLTIDRDGGAGLIRRNGEVRFQVDPRQHRKIRSALAAASFSKLKGDNLPERPQPDSFRYSVTYQGHTVVATDSTVPSDLRPALGLLQEVVDSHRVR